MRALPVARLTPDEYLRLDRAAERKSEYYDGEIFPIEDAMVNHALVSIQFALGLSQRLRGSGCRVLNPVRLRIAATRYLYPDLMVICGQPQTADENNDTLINAKVIVEVLSPSTADYCYGRKFQLYHALPSLEDYVLVSQDRPRIDVFHKTSDRDWTLRMASGLESSASIASLSVEIPLAEVYDGVTLEAVV